MERKRGFLAIKEIANSRIGRKLLIFSLVLILGIGLLCIVFFRLISETITTEDALHDAQFAFAAERTAFLEFMFADTSSLARINDSHVALQQHLDRLFVSAADDSSVEISRLRDISLEAYSLILNGSTLASTATSSAERDALLQDTYYQLQPLHDEFTQITDILFTREGITYTRALVLLIGLFAAMVLCIAILFFHSLRTFLTPLKELTHATDVMEKGNLHVRTEIHTNDEFGILGQRFNKMVQSLSRMDKEHQELDKAKTEFLSITSHELQSPLTPMKAQLQMLLEGYFGRLTEKQRKSLDIILRNTERLDRIILDFLEVSRIEAARLKFHFVRTNLSPHIQRLVQEMCGFHGEKKIHIVAEIGTLPTIEVDPDRVMQVLRNLINNAIKFSPDKGKIVVRAERKGSHLLFSVRDVGIGIKPEQQKTIFEPFFQVEHTLSRKYSGTGLGLTICKGIVESQNGRIWVESSPGRGSTFFFTVPLKPVKELRPITLLFSSQHALEKKLRAIFVDHLGPLGGIEFDALYTNGFSYDGMFLYVTQLKEKHILNAAEYKDMVASLRGVLGTKEYGHRA